MLLTLFVDSRQEEKLSQNVVHLHESTNVRPYTSIFYLSEEAEAAINLGIIRPEHAYASIFFSGIL